MTGVLFVAYGAWCLFSEALLSRRGGSKLGAPLAATARWIRAHLMPLASAGILFMVIWVTMYTGFGKHREDWLAIPKAVKYWMGQHAIARIPGPWYYYFPQLAYYETAVLLAALFAFRWQDWRRDPFLRSVLLAVPALGLYGVAQTYIPALAAHPVLWVAAICVLASFFALSFLKPPPEPTLTPFLRFMAFWAVGSLAIYSWAREKVPWLTVHPLLPLTILAAVGFARLWGQRARVSARVALAAIAVLLAVNIGGMYYASFRYGAHDVEREPKHAEMLSYVQTSRDLIRALDVVNRAKERVPAGQPVITAGGEASWPLTWYLRDVPTNWATRIDTASTPIIVADWEPEGSLEKQLAPQYDAKRVPIRAWWFPEVRTEGSTFHPSVKDFLRWWLFHEIWTPIGSQDTVFYVRKDLASGSGPLPSAADRRSRTRPPGTTPARPPTCRRRAHLGRPGNRPGAVLGAARASPPTARGNIYVADTKNSRIQIFDGNGTFLRAARRPRDQAGEAQRSLRRRGGARRRRLRRRHLEPPHCAASARTARSCRRGWIRTRLSSGRARVVFVRQRRFTSRTPATSGSSASTLQGKVTKTWGSAGPRPGTVRRARRASRRTPPAASTSRTRATTASRSSTPRASSSGSSRSSAGRTSTRSRTSWSARRTAFS